MELQQRKLQVPEVQSSRPTFYLQDGTLHPNSAYHNGTRPQSCDVTIGTGEIKMSVGNWMAMQQKSTLAEVYASARILEQKKHLSELVLKDEMKKRQKIMSLSPGSNTYNSV